MKRVRFFIALWYYKAVLLLQKAAGRGNRLYPGFTKYVLRICPDFLKQVGKPAKIICVTGTNGKTSSCGVVRDLLRLEGKKVLENWEWSMRLGFVHAFTKDCTVLGKGKSDYGVFELDELKSLELIDFLRPDYMIVTNLFRDSLKRNGYPRHILSTLEEAVQKVPDIPILLNADDPISSSLRAGNPNNVYVRLEGAENPPVSYNVFDMAHCPVCGGDIVYDYRAYMHIGKVRCTRCDFASPKAQIVSPAFDPESGKLEVRTEKGEVTLPLLSQNLFNAYNELLIFGLMLSIGYSKEHVAAQLSKVAFPLSREDRMQVGDTLIIHQMAKGQNVSATTAVFEQLSKEKEDAELILLLDENEGKFDAIETITWLYDTDFEFLRAPHIRHIVVGSKIHSDYVPRLLLAGLERERFVCCEEEEVLKHVTLLTKRIYLLYDSEASEKVLAYRAELQEMLKRKDAR